MACNSDNINYAHVYLAVLLKRRLELTIIFIVVVVAAVFMIEKDPSIYVSSSLIRAGGIDTASMEMIEVAGTFRSNEFLDLVARRLPFPIGIPELKNSLVVEDSQRTGYFRLKTVYGDPERAYEINTAAGKQFVEDRNKDYARNVEVLNQHLSEVQTMIEEIHKGISSVNTALQENTDVKNGAQNNDQNLLLFNTILNYRTNLLNSMLNYRTNYSIVLREKLDAQLKLAQGKESKIIDNAERGTKFEKVPRGYLVGLSLVFGFLGSVVVVFVHEGLANFLKTESATQ